MKEQQINWPIGVLNRMVRFTEDICDITNKFFPNDECLKNYYDICHNGAALLFNLEDKTKEVNIAWGRNPKLRKALNDIFSRYPFW